MTEDELRKIIAAYRPNEQVLRTLSGVKLVATVAPSASGKTTIMQAAARISPEIHIILGETTRMPRVNERPGIDYLFRNDDDVLNELKKGQLVDVIIGPSGDLYCTSIKNYSRTGTNTVALVASALSTFRGLPFKYFKAAFIVPSSFERWQEWLTKQAEIGRWTADQHHGRLAEARQSYEIALADEDMVFILNDEIDRAARRFLQTVSDNQPDDAQLAKKIAADNHAKLRSALGVQ